MIYKEGKQGRVEELYQISIHKFEKSTNDNLLVNKEESNYNKDGNKDR
jgi:hypothetical protein